MLITNIVDRLKPPGICVVRVRQNGHKIGMKRNRNQDLNVVFGCRSAAGKCRHSLCTPSFKPPSISLRMSWHPPILLVTRVQKPPRCLNGPGSVPQSLTCARMSIVSLPPQPRVVGLSTLICEFELGLRILQRSFAFWSCVRGTSPWGTACRQCVAVFPEWESWLSRRQQLWRE